MNQRFTLVVLFSLALAASLVAADEQSPAQRLAASKTAWAKAKEECKGNYEYSVRFTSAFGFGHETVIVVKSGKIAERRYRSFSGRPVPVAPGEKPKEDGTSWTEVGDELGKHKEGAPLKTIDDLYAEAAKLVEQKRETFERFYLAFDGAGLLRYCFVVDSRIADDAPQKGVNIAGIKLAKPQEK